MDSEEAVAHERQVTGCPVEDGGHGQVCVGPVSVDVVMLLCGLCATSLRCGRINRHAHLWEGSKKGLVLVDYGLHDVEDELHVRAYIARSSRPVTEHGHDAVRFLVREPPVVALPISAKLAEGVVALAELILVLVAHSERCLVINGGARPRNYARHIGHRFVRHQTSRSRGSSCSAHGSSERTAAS